MPVYDVAVVGAGPAGLAVARRLSQRPLKTLVLERTATFGQVWANHYEGLTLNTVARLSRLAGKDFPAKAGIWPRKDDVARYLAELAQGLTATVHTDVDVQGLAYASSHRHWTVQANSDAYVARNVVLATGSNHEPLFPEWVSRVQANLPVIHSSQYRSPEGFDGQAVLVVGGGNSGAEIACRVAQTADKVTLSLREAPLVLPKQIGPLGFTYLGLILRHIPAALRVHILRAIQRVCLGNHDKYGLPLPSCAYLMNGGKDKAPTFYPDFLSHVREGKVQIRGGVADVGADGIRLKRRIYGHDEESIKVDRIICATGFSPKPGIEILRDSRSVTEQVLQKVHGGMLNPAPGLYALGFVSPISGQFREINKESKKIVARLA